MSSPKRILLLSDTHGCADAFILKYAAEVDEIWHAGDIGPIATADALAALAPLRAVHGNIDDAQVRLSYPEDLAFECNGLRVWMTHIGGYPGKYPTRIRSQLLARRPQLFISGHSHILRVINDPKLQCMTINPGAAGIHGFHQVRTMLQFEVFQGKMQNMLLIERPRSQADNTAL